MGTRFNIDPIDPDLRAEHGWPEYSVNDRKKQGQCAFMGTKEECEAYVSARMADPNEGDDW